MTTKASVKIIQLADIHFNQRGQKDERRDNNIAHIKSFLSSLAEKYRNKRLIDFLILNGDFVEIDNKNQIVNDLELCFDAIEKKLVGKIGIDRDRVLVVPGNHDQDILELLHTKCTEYGYSTGEFNDGQFHSCHLSYPNEGIAFTLFNSGGDDPQISKEQYKRVERDVVNSTKNRFHKIAVFHHHLLPLPSEKDSDYPMSCDVLSNTGQILEWLVDNKYFAVLHGHKHSSNFSKYSRYKIDENSKFLDRKSSMYIISGDSCGAIYKNTGKDTSFKEITINNRNISYKPQIQIKKFRLSGVEWIQDGKIGYHNIREEYEKAFYKDETFLSNHLYLQEDDDFWDSYEKFRKQSERFGGFFKIYNRNNKQFIDMNILKKKQEALISLVDHVRVQNRNDGLVFSTRPSQLNNIYTVGNLFFSKEEASIIASQEFGNDESSFSDFINKTRWQNLSRANYNHLDWANEIIAAEMFKRYRGKKRINLLEAGYGGLCTLTKITEAFFPKGNTKIRYFGIDVSGALQRFWSKELNEPSEDELSIPLELIEPFPGKKTQLLNEAEFSQAVEPGGLVSELQTSFDAVVASYCFHHIPSPKRLIESVLNWKLPNFFFTENKPIRLFNSIKEGDLFKDYIKANKRDVFFKIVYDTYLDNKKGALDSNKKIEKRNLLESCLLNPQKNTLRRVHSLLNTGGYIFLADPNGYSSSFNRKMIFEDPKIAVSYFNEYTELCAMMEEVGFEIQNVFRQVKLRNLQVSNIPLNLEALNKLNNADFVEYCADIITHDNMSRINSELNGDNYRPKGRGQADLPIENDYEDLHLGYIIIAQKIPKGCKPKFYFKDRKCLF